MSILVLICFALCRIAAICALVHLFSGFQSAIDACLILTASSGSVSKILMVIMCVSISISTFISVASVARYPALSLQTNSTT